ncbi:Porphobilinogen deaminase [Planctomyces sp. SH-PL14]|nr:Porphobilinogen deaminase [Planctomyces sp. SH-PL14]
MPGRTAPSLALRAGVGPRLPAANPTLRHVLRSPLDDMTASSIRIATRASKLALWQAHYVSSLIQSAHPGRTTEIVEVSTIGDRDRQQPLSQMGGQGVFTREVQQVVLDGRADIAVHSLKDLPSTTVAGLALAGVPPRANRFDVLILPGSKKAESLDVLPKNARIGTGSLRRRAQLLFHRPDFRFEEARGNLDTRLRKLDEGQFDALLLAAAGLERLGWGERISLILEPPLLYPAVGQAAIGIECRAEDADVSSVLASITCPQTLAEVTAERACLAELKAGCHAPVGMWVRTPPCEEATVTGARRHLVLDAVVLDPYGQKRIHARLEGNATEATALGVRIAHSLQGAGAAQLIAAAEQPA